MRHVGVLEAKTQLSALLEAVETTGEPVVITRHGKPIARLSVEPVATAPRRLTGRLLIERMRAIHAKQPDDPEWSRLSGQDINRIARDQDKPD